MRKNLILGLVAVACLIAAILISCFIFFHPQSFYNNESNFDGVASKNNNIFQTVSVAENGQLNGHKGFHYPRIGYQQYSDGWWYPKEAFVASN